MMTIIWILVMIWGAMGVYEASQAPSTSGCAIPIVYLVGFTAIIFGIIGLVS